MSYVEFMNSYLKCKRNMPTYRLGQHFINCFIKDSSSSIMRIIWEEQDVDKAEQYILDIIKRYHWDMDNLPAIGDLYVKN